MCSLESHLLAGLDETILKIEDPLSGAQTRFQFLHVEWFGEVIVGTSFKTCDDIFFLPPRGKHHRVHIGLIFVLANFPPDSVSTHLLHHPAQHSYPASTAL